MDIKQLIHLQFKNQQLVLMLAGHKPMVRLAYSTDEVQVPMSTEDDPDGDGIVGIAGKDYPINNSVPPTDFKCSQQKYPGYYADPAALCQVFHICQSEEIQNSFLCPNGSIFNQEHFVCEWWFNVDCSLATTFYHLNSQLFTTLENPCQPPSSAPKPYSPAMYPTAKPDPAPAAKPNYPAMYPTPKPDPSPAAQPYYPVMYPTPKPEPSPAAKPYYPAMYPTPKPEPSPAAKPYYPSKYPIHKPNLSYPPNSY